MTELTLIALSVVLIGMVCTPLILGHFKQKGKGKLLKEKLSSEAQINNLKTNDFQTWREAYCIGLDQDGNQLLFLNSTDNVHQFQKIDLKQVRLCRPIRNFRQVKDGKEKRQIINKVSLVMDSYDDQNPSFTIDLYDEEKSDYLINEWEIAQEWSKKINELKK
ncbi:hypothetical protein [Algoriphagus sp. NG3]|uniref:hypothetical protein n=1 Tax=unclassified Algoriphagus TaxID=2641541 RepID=UPI002A83CF47|nr:hypothetical protein [Algoriphagus sp. NG3]WPR75579.1 hypothetical protein SLW71_23265 [Algoriphagus sp. NG3]